MTFTWNYQKLIIRHKLNFKTNDFMAEMQYFIVRAANFEPLNLSTFLGKNTKFLCPLDWKFPEFFKTHPTFICRPLLRPVMGNLPRITVFLGHPVKKLDSYEENVRRRLSRVASHLMWRDIKHITVCVTITCYQVITILKIFFCF